MAEVETNRLLNPEVLPDRELLPFHNSRGPNISIQCENATHRAVLYMYAGGQTLTEISRKLNVTIGWLSQIKRQPWFEERLAILLAEAGEGQVHEMIQKTAPMRVVRLIELAEGAKSEAVKLAANNSLLDRALGKAPVYINQTITKLPTDENVEELDKKLDEVEGELKEITNGNRPG